MSKVLDYNDIELQSLLINSDKPVFIDFWAEWCGPCRMVEPVVSELSETYESKIIFVKVNVDENPQSTAMYGIRSIPTFIVIKSNELIMRHSGAVPKSSLVEKLNKLLT
jgi:thioredoxin 1